MAKYEHGTMDASVQEKTFSGFVSFVTKSVIFILLFLIFLAVVGG